ncbi:hypothetical protein ASPTUDRAFT_46593 [Aspergillus tubingensis CBS 134.48]|uniref:Uncharacterized protein n=1 Tax=Aspergillus tubingensis (strain CBS 134.48) TaxID=767770 RepID=A0A1L9MWE6_ASPTC|nr:hypothetical protein ASPTUDRAFT_46593 [Aspergillus tubingensis CBS 134.48]
MNVWDLRVLAGWVVSAVGTRVGWVALLGMVANIVLFLLCGSIGILSLCVQGTIFETIFCNDIVSQIISPNRETRTSCYHLSGAVDLSTLR